MLAFISDISHKNIISRLFTCILTSNVSSGLTSLIHKDTEMFNIF